MSIGSRDRARRWSLRPFVEGTIVAGGTSAIYSFDQSIVLTVLLAPSAGALVASYRAHRGARTGIQYGLAVGSLYAAAVVLLWVVPLFVGDGGSSAEQSVLFGLTSTVVLLGTMTIGGVGGGVGGALGSLGVEGMAATSMEPVPWRAPADPGAAAEAAGEPGRTTFRPRAGLASLPRAIVESYLFGTAAGFVLLQLPLQLGVASGAAIALTLLLCSGLLAGYRSADDRHTTGLFAGLCVGFLLVLTVLFLSAPTAEPFAIVVFVVGGSIGGLWCAVGGVGGAALART